MIDIEKFDELLLANRVQATNDLVLSKEVRQALMEAAKAIEKVFFGRLNKECIYKEIRCIYISAKSFDDLVFSLYAYHRGENECSDKYSERWRARRQDFLDFCRASLGV